MCVHICVCMPFRGTLYVQTAANSSNSLLLMHSPRPKLTSSRPIVTLQTMSLVRTKSKYNSCVSFASSHEPPCGKDLSICELGEFKA